MLVFDEDCGYKCFRDKGICRDTMAISVPIAVLEYQDNQLEKSVDE